MMAAIISIDLYISATILKPSCKEANDRHQLWLMLVFKYQSGT